MLDFSSTELFGGSNVGYLGLDMSQEGVEGASRIQIEEPEGQLDKKEAESDGGSK